MSLSNKEKSKAQKLINTILGIDYNQILKFKKIESDVTVILPDGTQIICKPSQAKDILENNSETQLLKILRIYC